MMMQQIGIIISSQETGKGGIINYKPETYSNAMRCEDSSRWKLAMEEKMHSLMKNNTWELVSKLEKQRVVDCKWIYKIKEGNTPRDKVRYKARLVAKGFTQREDRFHRKFFTGCEIQDDKNGASYGGPI
ncbi:hypothetical protein UlMin_013258 [Ulmus minor]